MARLTRIVTVLPPNYDGQEAMNENGEWLTLVSNFHPNELEKYKQLVKSFNSHVIFAISDDAWGFYEDEGRAFKTEGYGLYISNRTKLAAFWEHEKRMKHVHSLRPGYQAGYVSYTMKEIKKPRTNTQKKKPLIRLFKHVWSGIPYFFRNPELNNLDFTYSTLTRMQRKDIAKELCISLPIFDRYAKRIFKGEQYD